jgi:hypothetical protein
MILRLDAKRRLTLPAAFASSRPGDHFSVEFDAEEDALICRRLARGDDDWLGVLRQCPLAMDDLPPRRREYARRRRL